jgi:hypothetical protein
MTTPEVVRTELLAPARELFTPLPENTLADLGRGYEEIKASVRPGFWGKLLGSGRRQTVKRVVEMLRAASQQEAMSAVIHFVDGPLQSAVMSQVCPEAHQVHGLWYMPAPGRGFPSADEAYASRVGCRAESFRTQLPACTFWIPCKCGRVLYFRGVESASDTLSALVCPACHFDWQVGYREDFGGRAYYGRVSLPPRSPDLHLTRNYAEYVPREARIPGWAGRGIDLTQRACLSFYWSQIKPPGTSGLLEHAVIEVSDREEIRFLIFLVEGKLFVFDMLAIYFIWEGELSIFDSKPRFRSLDGQAWVL